MEEHVLVCEKVSKRFGQRIAVHDVSLSICPGEIYGLAGPNGAGKTTLISLTCGLVRPTSGNIRTFNLHPTQALSDIGVCFQTPSLYSYLSVEKNIRLLSNYPVRAYQYLEQLELDTSILKRRTAILSYGQQKRVGLAISLSRPARLYLLDEPTNGLDMSSAKKLCALLQNLALKGNTILLTSHEWEVIGDICHRVGIIIAGNLQRELTIADNGSSLESIKFRLVTNPRTTEGALRAFPSLHSCRFIQKGEWELELPECDAQDFMGFLSTSKIPVIQWRQVSTTEHWRLIYQNMLNKEGSKCLR